MSLSSSNGDLEKVITAIERHKRLRTGLHDDLATRTRKHSVKKSRQSVLSDSFGLAANLSDVASMTMTTVQLGFAAAAHGAYGLISSSESLLQALGSSKGVVETFGILATNLKDQPSSDIILSQNYVNSIGGIFMAALPKAEQVKFADKINAEMPFHVQEELIKKLKEEGAVSVSNIKESFNRYVPGLMNEMQESVLAIDPKIVSRILPYFIAEEEQQSVLLKLLEEAKAVRDKSPSPLKSPVKEANIVTRVARKLTAVGNAGLEAASMIGNADAAFGVTIAAASTVLSPVATVAAAAVAATAVAGISGAVIYRNLCNDMVEASLPPIQNPSKVIRIQQKDIEKLPRKLLTTIFGPIVQKVNDAISESDRSEFLKKFKKAPGLTVGEIEGFFKAKMPKLTTDIRDQLVKSCSTKEDIELRNDFLKKLVRQQSYALLVVLKEAHEKSIEAKQQASSSRNSFNR